LIKQFKNILIFCKEALSVKEGPLKSVVSVLFVLTGSIFFFKQIYASFLPGIMMLSWIFIKDSPRDFFRNYLKSGIWLFLLVYLAYAVSIIYSSDKLLSRTILETKLLLPILPLLLVKQWKPSRKLIHLFFIILTIAFIVMLIFLWIKIHQIYAAGHIGHWRLEQSWYLNKLYGLHHGDYAIIGLFISVYFAIRLYQKKSWSLSWIPIILFWFLIFFTGSDINRVISGILVITLLIDYMWRGFRKAFPVLYIMALIVILVVSFSISGAGSWDNSSNRLMIWPASVELIKEKPLIGHGVGDVGKLLTAKYQELGFEKPVEKVYNSHNQFLDIALSSGILGLGTLIALLVSAAFAVSRTNNLYGILFLTAITLVLSVENLLSRLDGIIILSFFYVAFISLPGNHTQTITD